MTKAEIKVMRTKILQGIEISYNKLLTERQKEDGELVIYKNGKVMNVKARDLKMIHRYTGTDKL
jgi:predicted methyltransferase MtxX (methanogen marker protein 4)